MSYSATSVEKEEKITVFNEIITQILIFILFSVSFTYCSPFPSLCPFFLLPHSLSSSPFSPLSHLPLSFSLLPTFPPPSLLPHLSVTQRRRAVRASQHRIALSSLGAPYLTQKLERNFFSGSNFYQPKIIKKLDLGENGSGSNFYSPKNALSSTWGKMDQDPNLTSQK